MRGAVGAIAVWGRRRSPRREVGATNGPRRLLDEIDIISSVSGGSFTNAYFALHGDGIFDGFRDAMLLRPMGSDLAKALFDPRNWRDIASPYYGRSDLAAAYYDKYIFGSKTFADIPATAPLTIIIVSELGTEVQLTFPKDRAGQQHIFKRDLPLGPRTNEMNPATSTDRVDHRGKVQKAGHQHPGNRLDEGNCAGPIGGC